MIYLRMAREYPARTRQQPGFHVVEPVKGVGLVTQMEDG